MSWIISKLKNCHLGRNSRQQLSNSSSLISPENVLSDSNRVNCIKTLLSMSPVNVRTKENAKNAAVLVPLCKVDNELALLYIVRAARLKVNGGQVAFPGGMQEKVENLRDTALRETFEEIGIVPESVDVWEKGPVIHRPDVAVTPFLGYIGDLNLTNVKINYNEVSMVFSSSLNHLSSSENFGTTQFRYGKTHVYRMPVYINTPRRIWGLTAMITHAMLSAIIPGAYNNKFDSTVRKILGSKTIKTRSVR